MAGKRASPAQTGRGGQGCGAALSPRRPWPALGGPSLWAAASVVGAPLPGRGDQHDGELAGQREETGPETGLCLSATPCVLGRL